MTNRFVQMVDEQLSYNGYKSLFYATPSGRFIVGPSLRVVTELQARAAEAKALSANLGGHAFVELVTYATEKVIRRFVQANQFLNFTETDFQKLKELYRRFFNTILDRSTGADRVTCKKVIACFHEHYQALRTFLTETNGSEIFRKYMESPYLFEVVCAQYRAEFQVKLMGLDENALIEPVLDIGCGQDAHLVRYLRAQGIQAFGIDRTVHTAEFAAAANWLDYPLAPDSWGTVISHMAFTNHMGHHLFRKDGDYAAYVGKLVEILKSLKVGGSFVFSPSIPFLETVLKDGGSYRFRRYDEHTGWITRLA
ncbi:MAG TPA: class I SAM-dependent methyltransferase [Paenibacillus sp.]|nr:class I SAM-dependent methyltransferase [Paenibacillus sp.]